MERLNISTFCYGRQTFASTFPSSNGAYVRYEDHLAKVAELERENALLKSADWLKAGVEQEQALMAAERSLAEAERDAARYRWIRYYLSIYDIGDDDYIYGVTVRHEDMEEELHRAICWPVRPLPTERSIDAAIDAAMAREGAALAGAEEGENG